MNVNKENILQKIRDAEVILIGIGEEFNNTRALRKFDNYNKCRKILEGSESEWLIPALNMIYEKDSKKIYETLCNFAEIIKDKNYFVVSVSTNDIVGEVPWRENRLVMPCGGSRLKQCIHNCEKGLMHVTENDQIGIESYIKSLIENDKIISDREVDLGICPECGSPLVLNNIYTEKYDENGYLGQWNLYTKWLQGTLNHKLLILELGVGMQCPSVIRWPFEKVAFFNQKAEFYRVNEKLYQLSEELKGKGISIAQNAIDWLGFMC